MGRYLHGTSLKRAEGMQALPVIEAGLYVYPDDLARERSAEAFAWKTAKRDNSPGVLVLLDIPDEALADTPERLGWGGSIWARDELWTVVDLPSSAIVEIRTSERVEKMRSQTAELRRLGILPRAS